MPWVKLDEHFPDHPKIVTAGPLAGWLFVAGLCYSNRLLTDGFIPFDQLNRLLPPDRNGVSNARNLAKVLVTNGLWDEVRSPKGYRIHDYWDYQPSRADVQLEREKTRKRQEKWRKRRLVEPQNGNAVSNAVSNGNGNALVTLPPIPIPNKKRRSLIERSG